MPVGRPFETQPLRRHIDSVRNGTTAMQVEEDSAAHRVTRIETISAGVIDLGKIGYVDSSEEIYQFTLTESDILFSHINSMAMIGNSALVTSDSLPLHVGMNLLRLRCRKSTSPGFLSWCLKSDWVRHQVRQLAKPAINQASISTTNLKRILVPRPDHATQCQVADFLDREIERIDLLIQKKKRLVDLLAEKFETEAIRLMTCGVGCEGGDSVPSVYDWAPGVPGHWAQTPMRQLLRLTSQSVGEKSSDYVLLSLTKQGVILRDVDSGKGKFPADFSSYQVVQPNQLVLCLFDIDETPRTVGLSNNHGMVTGAYTVADINKSRVDPDFIYFHLLYLDNGKRLRPFYTGLRKVIRPQTFLNIRIPLPPMEEQRKIVQELWNWERRARHISKETNASIDRLKEYRSALITSAVRGQIDVETYTKAGVTDRRLDEIQKAIGA